MQGGNAMDTNMTFRIDSEVKAQMSAICNQLGMTTSTAFNIFANAFVRAKGKPFAVTITDEPAKISREKMLADTDRLLYHLSFRPWENLLNRNLNLITISV